MGKKEKELPYLTRDASWISFDMRVSDEAGKDIPLAEKALFHGISMSNLDEFLIVRYPACLEFQTDDENEDLIKRIKDTYLELSNRIQKFISKTKLVRPVSDLSKEDRKWADRYFL